MMDRNSTLVFECWGSEMDDAIKGLVYLVLTVGGVAAIAVGILWWKLAATAKQLAIVTKERAELQRKLDHHEAAAKAEGMNDEELLSDVSDVLGRRK